ncbi:MAG TPA: branched-chain amino acid ABC transporter substrate-binding protein [Candidatus Limnocylindrales bacterium]|nr:branched-chain amino acid ABC transporter substrate-binding protein [Candidatus Limnocylindrales bacterium]
MKLTQVGALAATAILALAACQPSGGGTSAAPGGSAGAGAQPEVCKNKKGSSSSEIHVYSSLPRQGTNTEQTDTLVEEIKETLDGQKIGNFTIKYTDLDDSSAAQGGDWDGAVEQANANRVVADPDAMVYIGTYNSGAAKLSIPILNAACLVMISPANTYPGLTKAVEGVTQPGEPDTYYPNGYRNYSRPIATDDIQGAAGAEWAKSMGKTKAYVLDDTQTYGHGLAAAWALHANKIGLTVVSPNKTTEGFDAKSTDYAAVAQKIKASGADVIYIGSITGQNTGKLWKDLRAALPDMTIMTGDGVFEKSWYDGAGDSGNGTFLTFGGVGPDQLTGEGKTWFEQYKTDHGGTQPATYTAYGNAAATIALNALKTAATPNDRWEILKTVMATKDLETVVGKVTLDPNGDALGGSITAYKVETSWPPTFQSILSVAE